MRQREEERSGHITDRITNVTEQRIIKFDQSAILILVACCVKFPQYKGMAANGTLAVDDEATREDIGSLNGNSDRRCHECTTEIIFRAQHDTLSAMHVHRIVGYFAAHLCAVILEDRRGHSRFFTLINCPGGYRNGGIHNIGMPGDAGQRFSDALEIRNRCIELFTNGRVSGGRIACCLAAAGRCGWQRNGTADG